MAVQLLPIPDVPQGLREAALRGNLIPFIGAGVSVIAGCPGWNDFADAALRWLIDQGRLSYSHVDQIRHLPPRVKLSLARALAIENKAPINFEALIHAQPQHQHQKGCRIYNSLFTLGTIFVTTNYDLWLDERIPEATPVSIRIAVVAPNTPPVIPSRIVYRREELLPSLLTRPHTVIHLHGSVRAPETMILTTSDYIRHYAAYDRSSTDPDSENRVLTFLDFLFRHKTVLFVGYGVEELEILEYVISKGRHNSGEARHYMLQGFFSHQQTLMRNLASYYLNECGIELVPFRRDERDWDQLLEVVDAFAQNMPATTPFVLQKMQDMEELLR
jgi:hypothetical protein